MPQKLEIWFVHNSLTLVNPHEILYQCLILCRSHVQKGTKIAFLQYCAAYQWTSRQPRDLKLGQYITHSTQFVHAKFHVHAAFFGGATHNTVPKITFLQHFSAFSQHIPTESLASCMTTRPRVCIRGGGKWVGGNRNLL